MPEILGPDRDAIKVFQSCHQCLNIRSKSSRWTNRPKIPRKHPHPEYLLGISDSAAISTRHCLTIYATHSREVRRPRPLTPFLPRRVLTRNPSHVIHKADRYPNRCAASFGDAHQVTSRTNTSCQHARWCEKTIPRIAEQGRMGVQMDGAY